MSNSITELQTVTALVNGLVAGGEAGKAVTASVRALKAVAAYGAAGEELDSAEPVESLIEDLLTDVRHLCATLNLSFDHVNEAAATHYGEES